MKRHYHYLVLLLSFLFLPIGLHAQQVFVPSAGTVQLNNWQPNLNYNRFEPAINSLALRYDFQPDSLQCKITMSVQWYAGTQVIYNRDSQNPYEYPLVTPQDIGNFTLLDLEVEADLYRGSNFIGRFNFTTNRLPQSGGNWGQSVSETRSWSNLLTGTNSFSAKAGFSANTTLKNLKIRKINFGGENQFRTAVFQKIMQQAQGHERRQEWQNALDTYQKALSVQPTNTTASGKVRELERKFERFNRLVNEADRLADDRKYLEALESYQRAENQISGQLKVQDSIRSIENRKQQFDNQFSQAQNVRRNAKTTTDLLNAKLLFAQTLALLPIERKTEVDREVADIDRVLEAEYKHLIQEGDLAFSHAEWAYAGKQYVASQQIFNRDYPSQRIRICTDSLTATLTRDYSNSLIKSKKQQDEWLEKTAMAINIQNEQCLIQFVDYEKCNEDYFQNLLYTVAQEVNEEIFQEGKFNKPYARCNKPTCVVNPALDNAVDAVSFFDAAKRKYSLQQRYKNDCFVKYQNEFLDKATDLNPNYVEAYLFRAEKVETSAVNKLLWYNRVLEIEPNNYTAKQAKDNLDKKLYSTLYTAIDNDRLDEIQKALHFGLLKTAKPQDGKNLVEYAIYKDNAVILSVLLNNPALLNPTIDLQAEKLLAEAVRNKSTRCTDEILVNRKANPNAQIAGQESFLVQAVKLKSQTIAEMLLKAGAKPNSKGASGKTAYQYALDGQERIIAGSILNYSTLAQIAVADVFATSRLGYADLMTSILDKGFLIDTRNSGGSTLLHISILQGHSTVFQLLINRGANIQLADSQANTPLILSMREKRDEFAKSLLKTNRVNVNAKNSVTETPFYWAIKQGLFEASKLLLAQKADYQSVFSLAKSRAEQLVVNQLAIFLAQEGLKQKQQIWVNEAVAQQPKVGYLANKEGTPLAIAAMNKQNDWFLKLAGKDFTQKDDEGNPAIHIAIRAKNLQLTKMLLEDFTDNRNLVNQQGISVFHYIVATNFESALPIVLQYANVNQQDSKGWAALHYAIYNNHPTMISALMRSGANPKIKNNDRQNAKKFAKKQGKKHLKRYLKK